MGFGQRSLARLVCAGLVLGLAASAGAAVQYAFVDLTPSSVKNANSTGIGSGQQVGYGQNHALLWSGTADSMVDLNPSGFSYTQAQATYGGKQIGYGGGTATGGRWTYHALLWSGTANSVVDLNPIAYSQTQGNGIRGDRQVGLGTISSGDGQVHALLWRGSASSVVDLQPAAAIASEAFAVADGVQVGCAIFGQGDHAALWRGTAGSFVDLNPTGIDTSYAYGVGGGQQVGMGYGPATGLDTIHGGYATHALLWSGTAASMIDLNPSGFVISAASGVSGGFQVGSGYGPATNGLNHALLWQGSANSVVDLHAFVPSAYTESWAIGMDELGRIVGGAVCVDARYHDSNGNPLQVAHTVMWVPVPEPATIFLLAGCAFAWLRRKT